MMRKLALALLVGGAFSPVLFAPGCGGTSSPVDAGRDSRDSGNDSRAGTGGGGGVGGVGGVGGGTAGTTGASGMDGGAAGMDAAAGTGAIDAPVDMTSVDVTPMVDATPLPQAKSWLFDTTTEGWLYTRFGSTPNMDAPDNLALLSGTPVWDGTNDADNKTTSGSLKGTIPFKKAGDRIDFQAFSSPSAKYNWMGYKISAKVKLVSGGNIAAGCPLTAWLYVSEVGYATRLGPVTALQTGTWVTLDYDLTGATINLMAINQMGIQITTGPTCPAGTDGGTSEGGVDGGATDGGDGGADALDGGADAVDAASVDGSDGGDAATDLLVDAGLGDVIDGATDVIDGGTDVVITATTAVILIDNVIVSPK